MLFRSWAPSPDSRRLLAETGARAVVSLDFHAANQFFPLALRFPFEQAPSESAVVAALRSGSFQCEALGWNVGFFTHPAVFGPARLIESARKLAAPFYRKLRERVVRTPKRSEGETNP